jgi:hypothetical protein
MTDRPGLDPARTALLVMGYSRGPHRIPNGRANNGHVAWVRVAFTTTDLDDATADPDRRPTPSSPQRSFPRHAIVIDVDDLPELWT